MLGKAGQSSSGSFTVVVDDVEVVLTVVVVIASVVVVAASVVVSLSQEHFTFLGFLFHEHFSSLHVHLKNLKLIQNHGRVLTHVWPLDIDKIGLRSAFHRTLRIMGNIFVISIVSESEAVDVTSPHSHKLFGNLQPSAIFP